MVILGDPKCAGWRDLGHEPVGIELLLVKLFDSLPGDALLLWGMIPNAGTILGSAVVALSIQGGGIVRGEEYV